jgi:uncharacterized protein (TIGR02145 family)
MKNLVPVLLTLLFIATSCEKENLPPAAQFTIDPTTGNELTIFMFDASGTTDPTDNPEDIMVMWDWEGDGTFDTQYAVKKTGDHKYAKPGEYMVTLVAKDPRGLTDTLAVPLTVSSSNLPPDPPFNPEPGDGAMVRQIKPWMKWDSSDPEGDPLLFTCYFGTTNPPPQVIASQMFGTFTQGQLEYGTTYYWKVRVKDSKGHITEGPVWSFTTVDLHVSTITDARDGKTYKTIQIGEDWWTMENMKFDTGTGCYNYDDNPARGETYGKLYTWDAATKACPEGWHLPTLEEYNKMVESQGGADVAGGKMKDYETLLWREVNVGADNYSGFTALPAGRRYDQGLYAGQGYYAQFWSSTEYNTRDAYNLTLGYDYAGAFIYNYKKVYAISVRCVKD